MTVFAMVCGLIGLILLFVAIATHSATVIGLLIVVVVAGAGALIFDFVHRNWIAIDEDSDRETARTRGKHAR